jgi:hypothetical protein
MHQEIRGSGSAIFKPQRKTPCLADLPPFSSIVRKPWSNQEQATTNIPTNPKDLNHLEEAKAIGIS